MVRGFELSKESNPTSEESEGWDFSRLEDFFVLTVKLFLNIIKNKESNSNDISPKRNKRKWQNITKITTSQVNYY